MPEDAVRERIVAGASRGRQRIGDGLVASLWFAVREQREREHPEREVPPGARLRLQFDRAPRIPEHLPCPVAAHRRAQHRPARLERGGAIRRATGERAPFRDVGEAKGPRGIAAAHALPGCQDGQPRPLLERRVAVARQPRLGQGAPPGPMVVQHHATHERSRQVEVSGRERVMRREVHLTGLCIPGRRPPMQLGHVVRLADAELRGQELAQQEVVPEPAAVLVHEQGRPREIGEMSGRPAAAGHRVAEGAVETLQDRGARQERDLRIGASVQELCTQVGGDGRAALGQECLVDDGVLPGRPGRECQQGRPAFRASRQTLDGVDPAVRVRAGVRERRPRGRPGPARPGRTPAGSTPARASGPAAGRPARDWRRPPGIRAAGT